jgi:hypothetical protein
MISSAMDVTRTKIKAPSLNQRKYYSMKDHFYALEYEIAVSLKKPHIIIWFNGPYPGGTSDITIVRDSFCLNLDPGERALSDLGYIGEPNTLLAPIKDPTTLAEFKFNSLQVGERQVIERVNQRLKILNVVTSWDRLDYQYHGDCVEVICKITNIIFRFNPLDKE